MKYVWINVLMLLVSLFSSLWAAKLKKLVILPINNITANADDAYLENSLTDAIRARLHERFAFHEMEPATVEAFARGNFYDPMEYYTNSIPLKLGIDMKQDVIIAGGFRRKGDKLEAQIRIFNITEKKLLTTIAVKMPTSSELFNHIEKLVGKVAEACESVLPNKNQVSMAELELDDEFRPKKNQVTLTAGLALFTFPRTGDITIGPNTAVSPGHITGALSFHIEWQRSQVMGNLMQTGFFADYFLAEKKFAAELSQRTAAAKSSGFMAGGLIGPRFYLTEKAYLGTYAMGGLYLGEIKIDYSGLESPPKDAAGEIQNSQSFRYTAPLAGADIRIGYEFSRTLALELSGRYQHLFFRGTNTGSFFLSGGLGIRF